MSIDLGRASAGLSAFTEENVARLQRAAQGAVDDSASEIKRRGDSNITRAGNFSSRWPNAFQAETRHMDERSSINIGFSSAIPYAHIHEFGGTIRGKPLLWIPLPWNESKERARDYPGQLFRVERPGRNPLLFSTGDKEAKYVGVTHVTLRPRFGIREIAANVVRTQLARKFLDLIRNR